MTTDGHGNQWYYLIRDAAWDGHIIAIQKVWDSAVASFKKFIKTEKFCRYIEIVRVTVNEFGEVVEERPMFSYSASSGKVVNHRDGESMYIEL